jgi:hypothetical protein
MFEHFYISSHAIQEYILIRSRRGDQLKKSDAIREIHRNLRFSNVKKIVNFKHFRHIFTYNSMEYILKNRCIEGFEDDREWILIHVNKYTRNSVKKAINLCEMTRAVHETTK